MAIYAHSSNDVGNWHLLQDHLRSVARLARAFAGESDWAEEAYVAGLCHDIGKYGALFQNRLQGNETGIDHWSQGAWLALTDHQAVAAAFSNPGSSHRASKRKC